MSISPPLSLLEFHPLAIYVNELLMSFNDFKLCAPLNLFAKVTDQIRESIIKIGSTVNSYFTKEKSSFDANESQVFNTFLSSLACVLFLLLLLK